MSNKDELPPITLITIRLFLVICAITILFLYTHNFILKEAYSSQITLISLVVSLPFTISMFQIFKIGQNRGKWADYSKTKTRFLYTFTPLGIWSICWLSLSSVFPGIYTKLTGARVDISDRAVKLEAHEKYQCRYQLKLESAHSALFYACITENEFNRLPSGPIEAKLTITKGNMGYIVDDVSITK